MWEANTRYITKEISFFYYDFKLEVQCFTTKVGSALYSTGNNTASFYLLRKVFKRTKRDKTTTWRDKDGGISLEHLSKEIEIETKVHYSLPGENKDGGICTRAST